LGLHALAEWVAWPPPSAVAWELAPLREPPETFRGRWLEVRAALADMVARARGAGAEPLVAFVPLDVQLDRRRNVLYAREQLPYSARGFVDADYTRDHRYRRALGDAGATLGVATLDLTPALRDRAAAAFLPADYHPNAAGHRRIARALAPAVAAACARTSTQDQPREASRAPGAVAYRPER
jgi:hypothetical protein